jgi:hypothetical protein
MSRSPLVSAITAVSLTIIVVASCVRTKSTAPDQWAAMNSGTTANLWAIWGASASAVFAVGDQGAIIRYDGVSWSPMEGGAGGDLVGIWGSSPSDVFGVGQILTSQGVYDGMVFHFDGNAWTKMVMWEASVGGVWGTSASDVYVSVGQTIFRYDGATWKKTNVGQSVSSLYGIWGESDADMYAVGVSNGNEGIIIHYDGSSWEQVGPTCSPQAVLGNVWGTSGSDVYAIGTGYYYFTPYTCLVHFDGKAWSIAESNLGFNGVWGLSPDDWFAAGLGVSHFDGSGWSPMSSPKRPMNAIWGSSPTDIFAVGNVGVILHYGPPE